MQHVDASKYGTIARCTVERCPDFTPATGSYFLAVVCKATRPAKQQHALDLWIEAMQLLPKDATARAAAMVAKLSGIGSVATARTEASQ